MQQLITALAIASIMSLVVLGTMLTFRMAGFPDLSVDGVFALGAVLFIKCSDLGFTFPLSVMIAMMGGAVIGIINSFIAQRFKIHPLLASVLILTMLHSINLRILGKPNLPLLNKTGQFYDNPTSFLVIALSTAVVVITIAYMFFRTEIGCAIKTTGSCPQYLRSVGRNPHAFRMYLVSTSAMLISLAGCLLAMKYRYADVSFGNGIIIVGIASLIIGEKLISRRDLKQQMIAIPIGSIVYQLAFTLALAVGLAAVDVKLGLGVITIALLSIGSGKEDDLLAHIG